MRQPRKKKPAAPEKDAPRIVLGKDLDKFPAPPQQSPWARAASVMALSSHMRAIMETLSTLPDGEREIIRMRYGLGDYDGYSHSIEEVSRALNVTGRKVRQIEGRFVRKLLAVKAAETVQSSLSDSSLLE